MNTIVSTSAQPTYHTAPAFSPMLAVVVEQILPAGNRNEAGFAGARAAGVCDYAVTALNESRHSWLREQLPLAWQMLEENHQAMHQCAFLNGTPAQQQATIQQLLEQQQQPFTAIFQRLINLALEGLLSDPRHGGNRHGAGWQLMNYQHREPA